MGTEKAFEEENCSNARALLHMRVGEEISERLHKLAGEST